MGLFGPDYPKRVTKEEFEKIRINLYGKLDDKERDEFLMLFRADLNEEGIESGISQAEFDKSMNWLKSNRSKHAFEDSDLVMIEKYFAEHLRD
ncbi:hypothetical protein KC723_02575 [Candidatus Kaiserbacteria bacterium]|nr:hypothetical protein [Candidatus Kaiserbacteria bacterium]